MKDVLGNRLIGDRPHIGHGVYFLFDDSDKLIYIGKSCRCHERVLQHTKEGRIPFKSHSVVPVPELYLDGIEAFLIAKHKPEWNVACVNASEEHTLIRAYHSQLIERQDRYVDMLCDVNLSFHYSSGAELIDRDFRHPIKDGTFFQLMPGCVVFRAGGRVFFLNGNADRKVFGVDPESYSMLEVNLSLEDGSFGRVELIEELPMPIFVAKYYWKFPKGLFLFGSSSPEADQCLFEFERDEFVSSIIESIDGQYYGKRLVGNQNFANIPWQAELKERQMYGYFTRGFILNTQ